MTDPTTRPADIEDENLVDHIIDDLIAGEDVHYQPLSGHHWTDDLPAVIQRVAHLVRTRDAQHLRTIAGGALATGNPAYSAGMTHAARIVEAGGAE